MKLHSLFLFLSLASAAAHPGVGIVQDRHGNVFFTDTKQVWKVTPDDRMSVVVARVHTHELCLDSADNLYGEHLWYEGDATKKWGHRVWCLKADGALSDIIEAREGFLRDYSFVRDRAGTMYWAERGKQTDIRKRLPNGRVVTHAVSDFRAVGWMTSTPDGTLFLMDAGDLRRISKDGRVTTVVPKLSAQKPPPARVTELNYHLGLWTDGQERVCVAIAAERLVVRVEADGQVKVVARSPAGWSPSGGMFDRDANLWLMEYDSTNAVRVRRIGRDGEERIFTTEGGDVGK